MTGYLQVYTGNGKGKSTAAFGLALRARGAGLKVQVIQFIKNKAYPEIAILNNIGVEVHQFGRGLFFGRPPGDKDFAAAREGLTAVENTFNSTTTDVLILDEINVALGLGLVNEQDFITLLDKRPAGMEVICTGRRAPDCLLEMADLVTEMRAVKHYYQTGVPARKGIEK